MDKWEARKRDKTGQPRTKFGVKCKPVMLDRSWMVGIRPLKSRELNYGWSKEAELQTTTFLTVCWVVAKQRKKCRAHTGSRSMVLEIQIPCFFFGMEGTACSFNNRHPGSRDT